MPTGRVTNRFLPVTAMMMTMAVGMSISRPAGFWWEATRPSATEASSPAPPLAPPKRKNSTAEMTNAGSTYLERSFTAPPISAQPDLLR